MNIELFWAKYKAKIFHKRIMRRLLDQKYYSNEDVVKYFKKVVKINDKNKTVILSGIGKVYPNGHKAVHDFNLEINPKEFIAFLGPSGCGKTTILRMISGLEYISEGTFQLGNVELNSASPSERGVSMVFQNYALYPYMNVYDNIAFGLKLKTQSNPLTLSLHRTLMELKKPDAVKIKNLRHKIWLLKHPFYIEIQEMQNEIKKLKRINSSKNVINSKKTQLKELIKTNYQQIQKNLEEIAKVKLDIKYLDEARFNNMTKEIKREILKRKKSIRNQLVESMVVWNKSIPSRIEDLTKMLGIDNYLKRKPAQLSGGQRQRVALARAISRDANIFLYDEPLSNLDAKLRITMRVEIRKIHNILGSISIYVTHDQVEAMSMADRIVVIDNGFVQQIGSPRELFDKPANLFVAQFIGTPAINLFDAQLDSEGKLSSSQIVFNYKTTGKTIKKIKSNYGKNVVIGFRPQDVIITDQSTKYSIEGIVIIKELLGHEYSLILKTKILGEINIVVNKNISINTGEKVIFHIPKENIHIFDKLSGISLTSNLNQETLRAHNIIDNSKSEVIKNEIFSLKERTKLSMSKTIINKILAIFDTKRARKLQDKKNKLVKLSQQLEITLKEENE